MKPQRDHEANAKRARARGNEARVLAGTAARRAAKAARQAEQARTVGARRLHELQARVHREGEQVQQRAAELHEEHARHEYAQALRNAARGS